jgi:hypothetical protein
LCRLDKRQEICPPWHHCPISLTANNEHHCFWLFFGLVIAGDFLETIKLSL